MKFINNNYINNTSKYIFILSFFSIIYSIFINPLSQEAVTFAYIIKNSISSFYFEQWASAVKNQEPTIQIIIPYFLLELGFEKKTVHVFWQSFTVFISILSVFLVSKLFTKSNFLSVLIVLILINHKFINTRLYGIYYPSHFYYFGQLGMYLSLLSFYFFFDRKSSISISISLFNLLIHGGWGIFNILLISIIKILNPSIKIYIKKIFLIFFIFILSFFILSSYTKSHGIFQNFIPTIENNSSTKIDNVKTKKSPRKYSEGHRIKKENYKNNSEYFFLIFKFIFFDLFLFLFLFLFYRNKLRYNKLLLPIIFYTIFIYVFLIFQNDILFYISKISEFLSNKIDRIIVNRYLNLNNIFYIILSLSIFLKTFKQTNIINKYIFNTFVFALCSVLIFFGNKTLDFLGFYGTYIKYQNLIIWSSGIFIILYLTLFSKIFSFKKKPKSSNNLKLDGSAKILLFSIIFYFIFHNAVPNLIKENLNKELFSKIELEKYDSILLGGKVYGKLDTLYYSDYTWVIPDPVNLILSKKKNNLDIFCINNEKTFFRQNDYYDYVNNDCFKNKTLNQWNKIKENYGFQYLIVPRNEDLNTNLIFSSKHFSLYKL